MDYRLSKEACTVFSRLDELFRDIGVLSTDSGNRSLAWKTGTHVLLETVALVSHQSSQSSQTRHFPYKAAKTPILRLLRAKRISAQFERHPGLRSQASMRMPLSGPSSHAPETQRAFRPLSDRRRVRQRNWWATRHRHGLPQRL
jgi:hypothetical protein